MKFKKIKSYAKINLSLSVIGKLKSGYHKIESLVSFVNYYDEILIKKIKNKNHKIQFIGKFSKGINKNNTPKIRARGWFNKCLCNYKIFFIKKSI